MKILLPFTIKDIGGTATFAAKFRDRISVHGHTLLNQFQSDFDVLLIIADCPLWIPMYAKLIGRKVVQRLDGVYHPATPAGRLYPLYNLKMWIIHHFLADTVIYQSKFSQHSCEQFLGRTGAKHTTIIYNGVDTEKILTRNSSGTGQPTKLITFAKFRRRDQIEPILESVKHLDPEAFLLDIYGSYTENLRALFEGLPDNIHFMGKRKNDEILGLLSGYDIFLFSDQSACPNSVLEAMAAGLPTVAFDRGSIPELIKSGYNGKVVSLQKSFLSFTHPYPFEKSDISAFVQSISTVAGNTSYYSKNAITVSHERFSLQEMVTRYDDLLKLTS